MSIRREQDGPHGETRMESEEQDPGIPEETPTGAVVEPKYLQ
jgi:hypothetical protein